MVAGVVISDGRSGVRLTVGTGNFSAFQNVQENSGAHQNSFPVGTEVLVWGRAGGA